VLNADLIARAQEKKGEGKERDKKN